MYEILLSGHFQEELQKRLWGRDLSQEGSTGSCSVTLTNHPSMFRSMDQCRKTLEEVKRLKTKWLEARNSLILAAHLGITLSMVQRENSLCDWFFAGQLLQFFEEKGCSSSSCVPLVLSASLGDNQTFGCKRQCCQDELCNRGELQGECQHISTLSPFPTLFPTHCLKSLPSKYLPVTCLSASELLSDFAHWLPFLPVKGWIQALLLHRRLNDS